MTFTGWAALEPGQVMESPTGRQYLIVDARRSARVPDRFNCVVEVLHPDDHVDQVELFVWVRGRPQ